MLNRIFFIIIFSGIMPFLEASLPTIIDKQPILSATTPAILGQNPMISTQEATDLSPLITKELGFHSNPVELKPSATIIELTNQTDIVGLTRRECILYGTRSGVKIGSLYGMVISGVASSSFSPQIVVRGLFVLVGTSSCAAVAAAFGAVAGGLFYAGKQLRNRTTHF